MLVFARFLISGAIYNLVPQNYNFFMLVSLSKWVEIPKSIILTSYYVEITILEGLISRWHILNSSIKVSASKQFNKI